MASPQLANGHISTPPPSDPATTARPETVAKPDPDVPLTSLQDDGLSKRPRDARLIHTVLQNLGVQSYQERVPLQLLDFAYRYTSGVLSDSLRLSAEGYAAQTDGRRRGGGGGDEGGNITVTALRQAIASRQGYAFESALPKEFMQEQAAERNRVALPKVERGYGVQLPEEKYCLTGVGWGLKEEWDSEEEEPKTNGHRVEKAVERGGQDDEAMGGMDGVDDEDDEGGGRMEDVFGEEGGGDDVMKED